MQTRKVETVGTNEHRIVAPSEELFPFTCSLNEGLFKNPPHVVIWIAAFPARPSVLLVTKSAAIAVTVDQPSVDVREMGPYFMMAALVSRLDAKNLMINFECAVTAYGPFIFRSCWLNKSTPLAVNAAWSTML